MQEDVYSTTDDMVDMRRRASLEFGDNSPRSGGGESASMTYGTLHRMGPDGGGGGIPYDQRSIYNQNEEYAGMFYCTKFAGKVGLLCKN